MAPSALCSPYLPTSPALLLPLLFTVFFTSPLPPTFLCPLRSDHRPDTALSLFVLSPSSFSTAIAATTVPFLLHCGLARPRACATAHGTQPHAARILLFFPLLASPHVPCPSPFPLRRRDHLRPRSSSQPSPASATVFLPLPSLSSLRPPLSPSAWPRPLSLIDAAAMISFAVALCRAFFLTFAHPLSPSLFIVTPTASITVTLRCSFLFLVPPFPFPPTVVPSLHRPPRLPSPSAVASLCPHRRPPPPRFPWQPLLRALPFPSPPSPTIPPSTTTASSSSLSATVNSPLFLEWLGGRRFGEDG